MRDFVIKLGEHIKNSASSQSINEVIIGNKYHVNVATVIFDDEFTLTVYCDDYYRTIKLYEDEFDHLTNIVNSLYNKAIQEFMDCKGDFWNVEERYTDEMGS